MLYNIMICNNIAKVKYIQQNKMVSNMYAFRNCYIKLISI